MVLRFRRLVKAAEWSRRWPGFIGTYTIICKFPCSTDFGSSLQEIKPDTKKYVLNEIRRMVEERLGDEEKLRTTRGGLELERLSKLLAERLSVPQREQFQQLQQLIQDRIIHNDFDKSCTIWRSVTEEIHSHYNIGLTARTTGNPLFTVCQNFYRVHYVGHTTNMLFAVCLEGNTRQTFRHTANRIFTVCQMFSTRQTHGHTT